MRHILLLVVLLICKSTLAVTIETRDLQNFWLAYDRLQKAKNTNDQIAVIDSLFFQTASEAQKALFSAKNYTVENYLQAIQKHPGFWNSIRKQMTAAGTHTQSLQMAFNRLQALYPAQQQQTVFLCIGLFELEAWPTANGIGMGAELLLAGKNVDSKSVIQQYPDRKAYFKKLTTQHFESTVLFNYTKQWFEEPGSCHLLAESIREGLCSWLVQYSQEHGKQEVWLKKGRKNEKSLKKDFAAVMFSPFYDQWLSNQPHPTYKYSHPGRYIGFALVELHLKNKQDTLAALKQLLTLDYNYGDDVAAWVDALQFFDAPLADLRDDYEASRPRVHSMAPIANGDTRVDYTLNSLVISFNKPIDPRYFKNSSGPLGKQAALDIRKVEISPDGRFVTLNVRLQPNTKYQLVLDEGYRNTQGIPLMPYLIEFKTKLRDGSTFEE